MSKSSIEVLKRPAETDEICGEACLTGAKKSKLDEMCENKIISDDSLQNDCELDSAEIQNINEKEKKDMCYVEYIDGLKEKDVGITEYINSEPGFSAILKERYSDFMVHEIDLEGKVVRLTDTTIPPEEKNTEEIADVISTENIEQLEKLESNTESSDTVVIEVTDIDKNARRKIHAAIRANFHGLDSTTENRGKSSVIIIKKFNTKSRNNRQLWPVSQGNFSHFVLYKENKDTQDAINTIACLLKMPPKRFSYAGTKDKRAKTVQMVTTYRVPAKNLIALNKKMKLMKIGNVQYKDSPIKLGDLSGNKFTVILRKLQGSQEEVEKAMHSLETNGFINYYGMQRFGTTSVATHHVGRVLIQSKWKEAVDLILKPRTGVEDPTLAASRQIWLETSDANRAYSNLNYKGGIEGRLLSGLIHHGPNDFVNALNSIPRNVRLMYIHSYQSFIWNKVVSKRFNKHGMKILVGDLVLFPCKDEKAECLEDSENIEEVKATPKYVTEEDLDNVSICNIVLPLPGHSIMYPKNETAEWYKEFLNEDGMDLNSFISKVRAYSLGGSYRKIVVKPTDVRWEIIPYDDFCEPLVMSDYDLMQGMSLLLSKDGMHKALKIEFKLPSSCYATMAIRDILKLDTSASAQKLLNKH